MKTIGFSPAGGLLVCLLACAQAKGPGAQGQDSGQAQARGSARSQDSGQAQGQASRQGGAALRVILIRHAEKGDYSNDLNCQGVNRSKELPALLYSRYGLPALTYVPAPGKKDPGKHSRMYQTIRPFVEQYHLPVNNAFEEDDFGALSRDVLAQKGTVLIVWDHSRLPGVARALGVRDADLSWASKDYDGIWIITYPGGKASISRESQGLNPSPDCPPK